MVLRSSQTQTTIMYGSKVLLESLHMVAPGASVEGNGGIVRGGRSFVRVPYRWGCSSGPPGPSLLGTVRFLRYCNCPTGWALPARRTWFLPASLAA